MIRSKTEALDWIENNARTSDRDERHTLLRCLQVLRGDDMPFKVGQSVETWPHKGKGEVLATFRRLNGEIACAVEYTLTGGLRFCEVFAPRYLTTAVDKGV